MIYVKYLNYLLLFLLLMGLIDSYCRSNSYTVYTYKDGHKESDNCCYVMWNCLIYGLKRNCLFFIYIYILGFRQIIFLPYF